MAIPSDYVSDPRHGFASDTVTYAGTVSGTSTALALHGYTPIWIEPPGSITAGTVGFQISTDGGTTYQNLYDETNTQYTVVVTASRHYPIDPRKFWGVDHIKLVNVPASTLEAAQRVYTIGAKLF